MDLAIFIGVFSVLVTVARATSLVYDCTSNDEVQISGFPAGSYYYAMQGSTQCNVTSSGTSISISGCLKDQEILVTYGSYSDMEANSLHGGQTVNAVKVTCNEIPTSGNAHNITNQFQANLTIDETQDVNPSYNVTSSLSATNVIVGTQITWTISFPVEYILEITECTASPGSSYVPAEKVDLISSGGCHVTDELISNFTNNNDGTATATIEAFKFYNNDNVFLECDLKICPSGSTSCDVQCMSKRDIHDMFRRSDERYYPGRVHNVLKVVDPSENSAMSVTPFVFSFLLTLTFPLFSN